MSKDQKFENKSKYKITNRTEYNNGLKNRGNITVWIIEEAIEAWDFIGIRERCGKVDYSDLAIETCLTIKQVMYLKLRQTEGFVESLFAILKVVKNVLDYSTLC